MPSAVPTLILCTTLLCGGASAQEVDPAAIMARVAANVEAATGARREYVYTQRVRSALVRSGGKISRSEKREYLIIPSEKKSEKKLVAFEGQYRKGGRLLPYSEPGFQYKDLDIDGELIGELTDDLVNDRDSRDGIPTRLFPLLRKDLPGYRFTWNGTAEVDGRKVFKIAFEPQRKEHCITAGGADQEGHCDTAWKGEAWVDAEEYQPVRIRTDLAVSIPWGVRVFLGTNIRQTGFSVSYKRVAKDVWFPVAYGTEFKLDVLWAYKRTITLAMDSTDFRRTDADSKITVVGETAGTAAKTEGAVPR